MIVIVIVIVIVIAEATMEQSQKLASNILVAWYNEDEHSQGQTLAALSYHQSARLSHLLTDRPGGVIVLQILSSQMEEC